MLIILEGTDCTGKTSLSKKLNDMIPLSSVLKLSGSPKHVDDKSYMQNVYESLIPFFRAIKGQVIILDRFCTSERVYSSLFKPYKPDYLDDYEMQLREEFDVVQIWLNVSPHVIAKRLKRKQTDSPNELHPSLDLSLQIQKQYEWVINNESCFFTYHVDGDGTVDEVANNIMCLLELDFGRKEDAYSSLV